MDRDKVILDLVKSVKSGDFDAFEQVRQRYLEDAYKECVAGNNAYLVKMLVEQGMDVNHADKDGVTPLMIAVEDVNNDVVDWLLQRGADVNQQDKSGNTAILYMVNFNNGVFDYADVVESVDQIIKLILAKQPDLELMIQGGVTIKDVLDDPANDFEDEHRDMFNAYQEHQKMASIINSDHPMMTINL